MAEKGKIRIGTSGWSYKHWKGPFYPGDIADSRMLPFYFQRLSTVEINSSFYHLPLRKTFENWRAVSPDDFVFAVKASRFITHNKKLVDSEEAVERFFDRASGLGEKIGPVLFQLPPGLKMDPERLRVFLQLLPTNERCSFEFRNRAWFHPEIYALLAEFGTAFCIYELSGLTSPMEITAGFIYLRLHGPAEKYQGRYSTRQLHIWQERIECWARDSRDVFCYFDNDEAGFAALNALELQQLVDGAGGRQSYPGKPG
jgi:uncharacterized protein YecE (DUF72 family)